MKRIWICVLLLAFTAEVVAIDDVLPLRSWRLNMAFMSLDGEGYFDHLEQRQDLNQFSPPRSYSSEQIRLRSEYGYRRNLTLVTEALFTSRELTGLPTAIKNDGFSHAYVGVRQRLGQPNQAIRFTAEYGVWVPVEADGRENLPIGNESADWQVVTGYAQDFFPTRGGFEMDFGYRFRAEDPEDEIYFDTDLFFEIFKLGEIRLQLHVLESQNNTGRDFSQLDYPDNRSIQSFKVEYSRNLTQHWVIHLGYTNIRKGRNVFDTDGWFLEFEWWR